MDTFFYLLTLQWVSGQLGGLTLWWVLIGFFVLIPYFRSLCPSWLFEKKICKNGVS